MAKSLKPSMKKLKETAEENTTIKKGNNSKGYETIKNGVPLDHDTKQSVKKPYSGKPVGMSKGITKNMDNYESLRVDCWLTDEVREDETVSEAFARVSDVLDLVLEEAVLSVLDE